MREKINEIVNFFIGAILLAILVCIVFGLTLVWKKYGGLLFFGVPFAIGGLIYIALNFVSVCIEIGGGARRETYEVFRSIKEKLKK
jgi:hypothetical protein